MKLKYLLALVGVLSITAGTLIAKDNADSSSAGGSSVSAKLVDYSLSHSINYLARLQQANGPDIKYGYDVNNRDITMLAETFNPVFSRDSLGSGSGYYDVIYEAVVVTSDNSSISRVSFGGAIRLKADFNTGALSGSDGNLSISGQLNDDGQYTGVANYTTDDGVSLSGLSAGAASNFGAEIGFAGQRGDAGFSGAITSGPFNKH